MSDLPKMPEPAWKGGDEFAPFHPSASHIRPDYRDGWNACYAAAIAYAEARAAHAVAVERERAEQDAKRYRWLRDEMTAGDWGRIRHDSGMPRIGHELDAAIDAAIRKGG